MRSLPVRVAALTAVGVVLMACGGSSTSTTAPPAATQQPSMHVGSAQATPSPAHRRQQHGGPLAQPTTAGGSAARPTASTGAGSGSQSSGSAGSRRVALPPSGTYTYHQSGTSSSALGNQPVDGDSTLTVDPPQG